MVIGWPLGTLIGALLRNSLFPSWNQFEILYILTVSLIARIIVGVLQLIVLKAYLKQIKAWWILISCIGWLIQFPGMVTGYFLMKYITHVKEVNPINPENC